MKKTLVIMGSHPKGVERFDWTRTDCDIWLFNEAPSVKNDNGELKYPKADAFFQLHHEAIWKSPKNRTDEKHYQWLSSGKTPKAYMQEKYKDVPKSVKYPIDEVLDLVKNVHMIVDGKNKDFKFFTCSPDYALALVAQMWKEGQKYKRVEIWGIELETESEYRYQRTSFGFWNGFLAALGVELFLYNSIFDTPMYGYEGDVAIPSKVIEKRIVDLNKELGDDRDNYNTRAESFLTSLSGFLKGDISASVQKELEAITKLGETAGVLNGKIKESLRYLEKARGMEEKAGSSVFSLGEFDFGRLSYTKQFSQVRMEAAVINSRIAPLLKRLLMLKKNSQKRQRAIDELRKLIIELMNKNMLLFHVTGAQQENQFYVDSLKLSYKTAGGKD